MGWRLALLGLAVALVGATTTVVAAPVPRRPRTTVW
jgi:hypothetical protein